MLGREKDFVFFYFELSLKHSQLNFAEISPNFAEGDFTETEIH